MAESFVQFYALVFLNSLINVYLALTCAYHLLLVLVAVLYYKTLVIIYCMHLIFLKIHYISPNALVACELLFVHDGLLSCVLAGSEVESLLMNVCTS